MVDDRQEQQRQYEEQQRLVESALAEAFPDEVDVLTTAVLRDIVHGKLPTIVDMEGATKLDVIPILSLVVAASQLGLATLALYLREGTSRLAPPEELAKSIRQHVELQDALEKLSDAELVALIGAIKRRVPA